MTRQQQSAMVLRGREEKFLKAIERLIDDVHLGGISSVSARTALRRNINRHCANCA